MYRKNSIIPGIVYLTAAALMFVLFARDELWRAVFMEIFPSLNSVLHPKAQLIVFVREHLAMVMLSGAVSSAAGIFLGVLVTRENWREFRDPLDSLASIGQTFPPVAVLALTVPVLGFGIKPVVIALVIFSLLPVIRNTISGIENVPAEVKEAAEGMGYTPTQILFKIEIPLSFKIILAGIRTSMVINTGTAAIGAAIGSGGLGVPVIAGLVGQNPAYILEGAVPAALIAVFIDSGLKYLENMLFSSGRHSSFYDSQR